MSLRMAFQPGDRAGNLTIIEQNGIHKKPCGTTERKWLCKCDCGNVVTVLGHNLKSGNTRSCGCLPKQNRLPDNRGVINHIILQYKRHAKDRELDWQLTYEQVESIIYEPCFYCGKEKSNHHVTKNCPEGFDHNGIDRVDNSKGYLIKNVVPCCNLCNFAKRDLSQKDFVLWAVSVAKHSAAMAEQWAGQAINCANCTDGNPDACSLDCMGLAVNT